MWQRKTQIFPIERLQDEGLLRGLLYQSIENRLYCWYSASFILFLILATTGVFVAESVMYKDHFRDYSGQRNLRITLIVLNSVVITVAIILITLISLWTRRIS
jgi:hypothetical protein